MNTEVYTGVGQGESSLQRDKARIEESDLMISFRSRKRNVFWMSSIFALVFNSHRVIPFSKSLLQFSSVQSLSRIQLSVTTWITARQASLSITNSQSSLRLMSIESVMPSSHLILSAPSAPAPNPSQHQSLFQWVNSSHEVAKVLKFQL